MIIPRDRLEVRLSVVTGHLQTRIDELCDALDGCMAKLVHGIPRAKDEVRRVGVGQKKKMQRSIDPSCITLVKPSDTVNTTTDHRWKDWRYR